MPSKVKFIVFVGALLVTATKSSYILVASHACTHLCDYSDRVGTLLQNIYREELPVLCSEQQITRLAEYHGHNCVEGSESRSSYAGRPLMTASGRL